MIVATADGFGTVSSSLIALPEASAARPIWLYAAGRPDEYAGLVGPLILTTHVDPESVALGETVHVVVSIRGAGNLWDVTHPLDEQQFAAAELFADSPLLDLRRCGRSARSGRLLDRPLGFQTLQDALHDRVDPSGIDPHRLSLNQIPASGRDLS